MFRDVKTYAIVWAIQNSGNHINSEDLKKFIKKSEYSNYISESDISVSISDLYIKDFINRNFETDMISLTEKGVSFFGLHNKRKIDNIIDFINEVRKENF